MEHAPPQSQLAIILRIISIISFTAILYLVMGIPMAVLPGYIDTRLGYGPVVAGSAMSVQYFATLLARPLAGRLADNLGAKRTVITGMLGCALSGFFTLLAVTLTAPPAVLLGCLIVGRLILGVSQGLVGTGTLSWGIGSVSARYISKVISWNGIASFGFLALGAPLGVMLVNRLGLWSLGASLLGLAGVGLAWALGKSSSPVIAGERLPFHHVFWRISSLGLGLALGSVGFGTIATFITLYFASRHWPGAAYCLTAFGVAYSAARLLLAGSIDRQGGFRVAIASFAVESAGLLLLWGSPGPGLAMAGAALTGFGLSLIYPALGVEVVARVPASNRGSALGAYSLCLDLSLGVTGPLMGAIASGFAFRSIFLVAALLSVLGLVLSGWLYRQRQASPARPEAHA